MKTIRIVETKTPNAAIVRVMRQLVKDDLLSKLSWSGTVSAAASVKSPLTPKPAFNSMDGIISVIEMAGKRANVERKLAINCIRRAPERNRRSIAKGNDQWVFLMKNNYI